jgi:hypothetical protein
MLSCTPVQLILSRSKWFPIEPADLFGFTVATSIEGFATDCANIPDDSNAMALARPILRIIAVAPPYW